LKSLSALKTSKFWTSATNAGVSCNFQQKYAWCSASELLLSMPIFSGFLKTAADAMVDRFLAFDPAAKDNTSMLTHENGLGQLKLPYICEPTCKTATCPSTCAKNVIKLILR